MCAGGHASLLHDPRGRAWNDRPLPDDRRAHWRAAGAGRVSERSPSEPRHIRRRGERRLSADPVSGVRTRFTSSSHIHILVWLSAQPFRFLCLHLFVCVIGVSTQLIIELPHLPLTHSLVLCSVYTVRIVHTVCTKTSTFTHSRQHFNTHYSISDSSVLQCTSSLASDVSPSLSCLVTVAVRVSDIRRGERAVFRGLCFQGLSYSGLYQFRSSRSQTPRHLIHKYSS